MKPIPLTARQIKAFDEIAADRNAAEATLNIALTHHSNATVEINKSAKELWQELGSLHGLNTDTVLYETQKVDGAICIVESEVQS